MWMDNMDFGKGFLIMEKHRNGSDKEKSKKKA